MEATRARSKVSSYWKVTLTPIIAFLLCGLARVLESGERLAQFAFRCDL
jgi:hypothetical protein